MADLTRQIRFPLPFTKMSGTGNDFIIIDNRAGLVPPEAGPALARRACRRMFSVGADGLILIEDCDGADFRWRFYNADGSEAEMCGNGARCAARFAHHNGIAGQVMRFETISGMIEAEAAGAAVKVRLTPPRDLRLDLRVRVDGRELAVHGVNTGVPHAVVFVDDIDRCPVREWGRLIRHHDLFAPAGTNVNFVGVAGEGIKVRTYERGVEDETLACGTGAVASALLAAARRGAASPVRVTTTGGDVLVIHLEKEEGEAVARRVFLEGPAHFIYEGMMHAEAV